jgi:hypothetical protein
MIINNKINSYHYELDMLCGACLQSRTQKTETRDSQKSQVQSLDHSKILSQTNK